MSLGLTPDLDRTYYFISKLILPLIFYLYLIIYFI
jgi:hypothetical protein